MNGMIHNKIRFHYKIISIYDKSSSTTSASYGSFTLHRTGTETKKRWVSILCHALHTPHSSRDRDREPLFSTVSVPVPVPVSCSVYEPLQRAVSIFLLVVGDNQRLCVCVCVCEKRKNSEISRTFPISCG